MAVLTSVQIQEILERGSRQHTSSEKDSCRTHDEQNRFHAEMSNKYGQPYRGKYLEFIGRLIASEKATLFGYLLREPIETIEFTESLFDEFKKVFEAQDRHIEYRFTNPALALDMEAYMKEIGDTTFMSTKGFEAMKVAINSIMIIDLPVLKEGEVLSRFPTPTYYLLDVNKLVDMDVDQTYRVEWIAFNNRYNEDILHIFDDKFFRTYARGKGGSYELVSEAQHDLGYTPARSFWTTPFQFGSRIQKKGPQSSVLTDLDWLLFLKTSTKHAELQAGFPIDVMYESKCTYQDTEGNSCMNGVVNCTNTIEVLDANNVMIPQIVASTKPCPACSQGRSLGAGSTIYAPARASNDDPDMLNAINRVSADVQSLEHLMKRIGEMETEIATNMCGYIPEALRQAMNKDQVGSMLESQKNVLFEVADNFEAIDKFVKETVARLRYGPQAVLAVVCNYGRKWFLQTAEQQQAEFKESKANGAANFELSTQFEQYLATKYKNNPTMLERMRILYAIEPYQNYTVSELGTVQEKFGLNQDLVRLKLDFMNYVNRFEREYSHIGQFMPGMSFDVKVAFVQDKLLGYVAEDYPKAAAEQVPPAGQGAPANGGGPPVV